MRDYRDALRDEPGYTPRGGCTRMNDEDQDREHKRLRGEKSTRECAEQAEALADLVDGSA